MENLVIFITLIVLIKQCSIVHGLEEKEWEVPVLLPAGDVCIQKAFELGFYDIRNERINGQDFIYKLRPSYHNATSDLAELIDKTNRIHQYTLPRQVGQPLKDIERLNNITKKLTIGPPYLEQTVVYAEFAFSLPTFQVAYVEISEPYDDNIRNRIQLPPSISGVIKTGRRFVEEMGWKEVIIVFDFSNARYRLSVNKLEEYLITPNTNGTSINVVYKARIRTEIDDVRTNDLLSLPNFNTRIVFLMVGVAGARQVFCEAYRMGLQKSKYVWILFEELPEAWATDKYNVFNPETGKTTREINCTPEELLSVATRYIFLIRGGIRRDNKITVNNSTANNFINRLQTEVGPGIRCDDSAGYAYDSVWASIRCLQKLILVEAPFSPFRPLNTFERGFAYAFGLVFATVFEMKGSPLFDINFEGVTGTVFFKRDSLFEKIARESPSSIFSKQFGEKAIWAGSYNSGDDIFFLTDNAIEILFGSNIIPSDNAKNIYREYQYPETYVITIWSLACLGIATTFIISCFITFCNPSKDKLRSILHWVDVIICFGCVTCFATLIIYGLDTRFMSRSEYGNICSIFTCTLSIGFTLTFGALFAKTWWKYKCFNAPIVQEQTEFSEWFMLLLIFMFLVIDIVVLVVWGTISPIQYTISNPHNTTLETHTEIFQVIKCDGKYHNQFTIGLYCYKGVLLVFGLFLAWQTTSKANKGTQISPTATFKGDNLSILNTVLVSIVGVICVSLLQDTIHRHALYAILALCIILCTSVTLSVIFLPKIREMLYPLGSEESSRSEDTDNVKLTKFTFKELRKRAVKGFKHPSFSSDATSQISISTATSSLDSRKNTAVPESEFHNEEASQTGSFVSYNPTISSLPSAPTIFEENDANTIENDNVLSVKSNDSVILQNQFVDDNKNMKI